MVLTDSSRKVLFRYPEPQKYIGKMLPDVLIKAMTNSDEGVAAGWDCPEISVSSPSPGCRRPGRRCWVFIGLPRDWAVGPVNRALWRNLIWLGLVALFAMAAAWYGGDLFIVRPVKKLRGCYRTAGGRGLERCASGPDYTVGELGLLAHSFDQMADSLQEREEDLRRAKDELEQRVQERTAELSAANEQLLREIEDRQQAEDASGEHGEAVPAAEQGQ